MKLFNRSIFDAAETDQILDTPIAFDDPVPADSGIFRDSNPTRSHSVERQVQRKLLAHPQLRFSSLVVRRTPEGVCLEGVLTATDGCDVCSLARQVEGVDQVLNHLLLHTTELPTGSTVDLV
ncbi:MAG: hypothetical protein ACK5Q5_24905 [Planctomycetaceae bacterium]